MKKEMTKGITPNKIALKLIQFYQKGISPYTKPSCKYIPTCSQYAIEAFEEYGFFKAFLKTLWRLLRCNPFSAGGYDPVKKNVD